MLKVQYENQIHKFGKKEVKKAILMAWHDEIIEPFYNGFDCSDIIIRDDYTIPKMTIGEYIEDGFVAPDLIRDIEDEFEKYLESLPKVKDIYYVEDITANMVLWCLVSPPFDIRRLEHCKDDYVLDETWVDNWNAVATPLGKAEEALKELWSALDKRLGQTVALEFVNMYKETHDFYSMRRKLEKHTSNQEYKEDEKV